MDTVVLTEREQRERLMRIAAVGASHLYEIAKKHDLHLIRSEQLPDWFSKDVDTNMCIDGMLCGAGRIYAVAIHTQEVPIDKSFFNTVTLRSNANIHSNILFRTEFHKLKDARENDSLRPHIHVQIYVREGTNELLAIFMVRTEGLFAYILEKLDRGSLKTKESGSAQFIYIDIDDLLHCRVKFQELGLIIPWQQN